MVNGMIWLAGIEVAMVVEWLLVGSMMIRLFVSAEATAVVVRFNSLSCSFSN